MANRGKNAINGKLLVLCCLLTALSSVASYYVNTTESFCGKDDNAIKCCADRDDEGCAHAISGTTCYCDQFCVEDGAKHDDCCPDYERVCLGEKEEEGSIDVDYHGSGIEDFSL